MAALQALGGGYGQRTPMAGNNNLLQFLQLGNEIGAEQGRGRDDSILQLIQALLNGNGRMAAR